MNSNNLASYTQLYSNPGGLNGGDAELSQSFLNFPYIRIYYSNDTATYVNFDMINTFQLDAILKWSDTDVALFDNRCYWIIKNYTNGTTKTLFKESANNCRIRRIDGVTFEQ